MIWFTHITSHYYYLFNCYYLTAFFFLEISITTTPAEIIIANANGTACIVSPVCAAGAFSDESVPVDGTFASSLLSGVEGVGFAIPINSTKDITDQLIKYSKVKRPYIGIGGIELDEKTAKVNNLVVGIYVKQL